MAVFTDTFDGAAGALIGARTGWASTGGYNDVWTTDGAGAAQISGADVNDGKGVLHDTGAVSHYAQVVLGSGFISSSGLVSLVACTANRYEGLAVRCADGEVQLRLGSGSVLDSHSISLAAGNTLRLAYLDSTKRAEVWVNGTRIIDYDVSGETSLHGDTKAGFYTEYSGVSPTSDVFRSFEADTYAGPPDVTAPTLSSATGTATGETTASGSVSTDDASGTLYFIATGNASESAATVKAGQSQAVTAAGVQSVSLTGLSPGTTYRIHYLHRDAAGNDSAVLSSGTFTTDAPDVTGPTLTTPTASATGAATATGSVTTNEANGTLYYLASTNATETVATVKASGASVPVSVTGAQGVSVSGLSASTTYYLHFVHQDAAGNDSARATSASFTTSVAPGTTKLTLPALRNNSGTLLANEAGATVHIYEVANGNKVASVTGATTDSAGMLVAHSSSMTSGTQYRAVVVLASGAEGLQKATATV